ncbi:MAG: hypothetical protein ACRDN1_13305, partial [Trebonia sp.]
MTDINSKGLDDEDIPLGTLVVTAPFSAQVAVICDNCADLLFGTIAGPFPRDFAKRQNVPGPLPKYGGRGPGTRARYPGGTP